MAVQGGTAPFHVLVIGAGCVGLLIAQHLKQLGIRCTVYEREHCLNERPRDWSFGIYWAQGPLSECLPKDIMSKVSTAQVDPSHEPKEGDGLPILNAETGDLLKVTPEPNILRLAHSKFRKVIAEGLNLEYGKRLSSLSHNETNTTVTAHFEDGTQASGNLLVGADGSKSRVRHHLLGPEADLQSLPLMGGRALGTLPTDVALKFHETSPLSFVAVHPAGVGTYVSLHEKADPERPETWGWMLVMTWRQEIDDESNTDEKERRRTWDHWSEKFAEPYWPSAAWDDHQGSVALAGDAAHPMTYHRGQGLNNAVRDAANIGRALKEYRDGGKSLGEAVGTYEEEVVERGREAMVSSGQNSMMQHDWSQFTRSPVFTMGMAPDPW